ncbi:hypothetical protein BB561_001251, partial [Smittium simulii]
QSNVTDAPSPRLRIFIQSNATQFFHIPSPDAGVILLNPHPTDNLLVDLVNKIESYSIKIIPKSLIHKKIVRLPDYAKIKAEISISSKDQSKTVLNNEMHKLKKLNLNIGQDTRASLVTDKTTNKKNYMDVCMFMKSKLSCLRAIKWRMSTLGYATVCPVCKNPFRHTHVERCLKIKNTDMLFDFKTMDKLDKRLSNIIDLVANK